MDKINTRVGGTDYAVMLTKASIGALPVIGPLMTEVIGSIIPNQRIDRIAELARILDEKLRGSRMS